jgi:hypothetical protein
MSRIDPELKAFIELFSPADLTDPVTAREDLERHLLHVAAK